MKAPSWPVLIGSVLLLSTLAVYGLAKKLGAFEPVAIEHKVADSVWILSKEHLGAYHKIAPLISEVEAWARANGEPCRFSFGEYFDDPEKVDEDRLRSRGGCILPDETTAKKLQALSSIPKAYKVEFIAARDSLVAEFSGSPSIGPMKVYSAVYEQMSTLELQSSGPVLEIYEVLSERSGRTRYVFPVQSTRGP